MMQNDDILFSEGEPQFSELFKADGSAYTAYVATNEAGERELHRVPMAVCDHGGHDHSAHSHEGHSHGHEGCDHSH